jgi:hypothetical protein
MAGSGCGPTAKDPSVASAGSEALNATIIPLAQLRSDPAHFAWFQFKPGVKKLILSGTPDSRHVSVLWYGYEGAPGLVPMHYHHKTESIFVIDGAQSDPKGRYERGSFYFNPPDSGHNVFDSAGLFLLSYAAPPDFAHVGDIAPYESAVVGADYTQLPFVACADGSLCHELSLSPVGGMNARFVKPQAARVALKANLLLVLQGACTIGGHAIAADTLVVDKSTDPSSYDVAGDCLLYTMAFQ